MRKKPPRINKVVTKVGDKGYTYIVGGTKVLKSSSRIEAYGNVDELNSILGIIVAKSKNNYKKEYSMLKIIQNDLFIAGADLATPLNNQAPRINEHHIKNLENWIENYLQQLSPLQEFILPGGSLIAAFTHFARTITRRTERSIVKLSRTNKINPLLIVYFNRLSDLLFVLARYFNLKNKIPEQYCSFNNQ
jgi:cob(I)alamin adenosyltransferase